MFISEERKRQWILRLLLRGKGDGGSCGAPRLGIVLVLLLLLPLVPLLPLLLLLLLPPATFFAKELRMVEIMDSGFCSVSGCAPIDTKTELLRR